MCFEGNSYLCKKQCSLKKRLAPFFFWLRFFANEYRNNNSSRKNENRAKKFGKMLKVRTSEEKER